MNDILIKNWNKVITPLDTVYHLGDFGWGSVEKLLPIFNRLNGKRRVLIKGNHDGEVVKLPWDSIHDMLEIKVNKRIIQLCHYPMRSWDKSFHGSWALGGHTHGTLTPHGWSCDVGVDCWGFTPVSFEQLETLFAGLPRDGQGGCMPKGKIWNGRDFPYSYKEFFIGDGSADGKDPVSYTGE